MEEQFRFIASYVALMLEALVVIMVMIGAIEATASVIAAVAKSGWSAGLRPTWLRFAAWILLALEFALGADIVRTAIAPSWNDIGQLGAIAAIRTLLGFFLGRDLEEAEERGGPPSSQPADG
jgi:uncharacterized membrane protein